MNRGIKPSNRTWKGVPIGLGLLCLSVGSIFTMSIIEPSLLEKYLWPIIPVFFGGVFSIAYSMELI